MNKIIIKIIDKMLGLRRFYKERELLDDLIHFEVQKNSLIRTFKVFNNSKQTNWFVRINNDIYFVIDDVRTKKLVVSWNENVSYFDELIKDDKFKFEKYNHKDNVCRIVFPDNKHTPTLINQYSNKEMLISNLNDILK